MLLIYLFLEKKNIDHNDKLKNKSIISTLVLLFNNHCLLITCLICHVNYIMNNTLQPLVLFILLLIKNVL